jgi:hypothetical protein
MFVLLAIVWPPPLAAGQRDLQWAAELAGDVLAGQPLHAEPAS